MYRHKAIVLAMLPVLMLCFATQHSEASGFAIVEQSARGIGTAFAGVNAEYGDAGAIWFNPAGMTGVGDFEVVAGLHAILPAFDFKDSGSTPVGGSADQDAGVTAWVPNFDAVVGVGERFAFGLGVHAPYGLRTEYDPTWIGRYAAVDTELTTININPSLAYQISENLSIGAGVSAQRADAELSTASPSPMGDLIATVTGDDWSYGWNVGAVGQCDCGTRLGISYRSPIEHELEGEIEISPLPTEAGTADIELPETAAVGIYVPIGDMVAVMADVTWTGWSSFQDLTVLKADGSVLSTKDESWEDTWRYAVGASVLCNDWLTLRAGAAFDESPVPDPEHRTARIPDADRTWLTLGAGFGLSDTINVDLGYVHIWFDDADINETYAPGTSLVGTYDGSVDIVSAQLKWSI